MKHHFIIFGFILSGFITAQESVYYPQSHWKKILKDCKIRQLEDVKDKEKLILCQTAYTETFDYRSALKVSDLSIQKFPYDYDVRLQRAIALNNSGSKSKAAEEIERLIKLYPNKAELHNFYARMNYPHNRMPSLMAFLWDLNLHPDSEHATENKAYIKRLLTISLSNRNAVSPTDANALTSNAPNIYSVGKDDFSQVEFSLYQDTEHFKKLAEASKYEFLETKLDVFCEALEKTTHAQEGFAWEFYTPYFLELKNQNLIDVFVHRLLSTEENHKNWLNANEQKNKRLMELNKKYFKSN